MILYIILSDLSNSFQNPIERNNKKMTIDQTKIYDECVKKLPLTTSRLSDEYYYDSLPLCVIDAVFSIGVRYPSTRNTVIKFCNNQGALTRISPPPSKQSDGYTIDDLLSAISTQEDKGASEIFENTQKTSSKNGILKSKAVYEFATVLKNNDIQTLSDIRSANNAKINKIEDEIKKIKGQSSGISFSYFLMLSGDDNHMKIDRWLLRFVDGATDKKYTVSTAYYDLKEVCKELQKTYTSMTPRLLDHIIWNYMK